MPQKYERLAGRGVPLSGAPMVAPAQDGVRRQGQRIPIPASDGLGRRLGPGLSGCWQWWLRIDEPPSITFGGTSGCVSRFLGIVA